MKKLKNFALVILCLGAITMMGACNMKVSSEETASRADQIAYLKEHEQEMTDMLKRNHPKIETIQYDWNSVQVGTIGNGTPRGAGKSLLLFGQFNHLADSGFRLDFSVDSNGNIDLDSMMLGQTFGVGGQNYE